MPRQSRAKSSTGIYHVILRGVNKQVIFEDDEDRKRLLDTIHKFTAICYFKLYSYCLMDNHIHLLVRESDEPISKYIQRISSSYVLWYNHKYQRVGHLFQERFKSEPVEDARYFLVVLRYIHQNSVKAGLAKTVHDSKWTSIHEYAKADSDIVDIHMPLKLFADNRTKATDLLMAYMNQVNEDKCLDISVKMTDQEVTDYILSNFQITSTSNLQQMNKQDRNAIIKELKQLKGVSLRQLSRITGLSKSVIQRI